MLLICLVTLHLMLQKLMPTKIRSSDNLVYRTTKQGKNKLFNTVAEYRGSNIFFLVYRKRQIYIYIYIFHDMQNYFARCTFTKMLHKLITLFHVSWGVNQAIRPKNYITVIGFIFKISAIFSRYYSIMLHWNSWLPSQLVSRYFFSFYEKHAIT